MITAGASQGMRKQGTDGARLSQQVVRPRLQSAGAPRSQGPEAPTPAELVELIGVYVDLKPDGGVYKAYCPLCHKDEYSFVLDPETGRWACNRCGEGGDVYHFFERFRRCSSQEAHRFVEMLLASNRRRGEAEPAVIRRPVARSQRSGAPASTAATSGIASSVMPSAATAPPPVATDAPPALTPLVADDASIPAVSGGTIRPEPGGGGRADAVQGAPRETVRDRAESKAPESGNPSAQLLARANAPVFEAAAAELARCAETSGPVDAAVAVPASPEDALRIVQGIADCIGETPACRGIAFVGDGQAGEPQIAAQYLDDLNPDDILEIERLMHLAVAGASKVLGGTDEGAGNVVVTLRSSRAAGPLDLAWCPLERGPVRFNALMSIDPEAAEGLLIMRLRCCVNRIVDH